MPTAREKNQARDRRKQKARDEANKARDEADKKVWALRVIKYYSRLWQFMNATAFMNKFKYNIIDRLLSTVPATSIKCINNWYKGGGYIVFYVGGMCDGCPINTSMVSKEFYHKLGHFVLTQSGSLYKLGHHQDDNFDIDNDKKHDMWCFRVSERSVKALK